MVHDRGTRAQGHWLPPGVQDVRVFLSRLRQPGVPDHAVLRREDNLLLGAHVARHERRHADSEIYEPSSFEAARDDFRDLLSSERLLRRGHRCSLPAGAGAACCWRSDRK